MGRLDKIAVIGAGLMGHGIAQEFALTGRDVSLNDVSGERLAAALQQIEANMALLQELGVVDGPADPPVSERIRTTTSLAEAVDGADLVVEAVFEDLEVKRELFGRLDRLTRPDTILASNSSTFVPSQLARVVSKPQRLLVAHYFNPPYLLPLVEIVPGPPTDPDAVEAVVQLMKETGKQPVVLQREVLGFVVNRLQTALIREAAYLVGLGVVRPEDLDLMVTSSFGRRLAAAGPFEVFDSAGWDVISAVTALLAPELDASAEVPPFLKEQVERGDLGIKTGRGVYEWDGDAVGEFRRRMAETLAAIERLRRK